MTQKKNTEISKTSAASTLPTAPTENEGKKTSPKVVKNENTSVGSAKKIAQKLKISTIYENSRGEFFTELTFAISSERGDKTKLYTHKF